jgi:spore maturation protein CgeB
LRIQTIATKYREYINQLYSKNRNLSKKAYVEQRDILFDDSFGAPDTRSNAFSDIGYHADHIFANIEPMQKRWAFENNVQYDDNTWHSEICAAQVKKFKPDILFISTLSTLNADSIHKLRLDCPSIRLVITWCGVPYKDPNLFRASNVILSNIPELVQQFKENAHFCYHINHGFDPRVLDKINPTQQPQTDFSFVGSILANRDFHTERENLIKQLVEETNIEIWANIQKPSIRQICRTNLRQVAYEAIRSLQSQGIHISIFEKLPNISKISKLNSRPVQSRFIDPQIAKRAKPPVFGLEMYQQLHNSKLTLNTHIDVSSHSASNMRLFEATGVGTSLLTDWKENLPEFFDPELEVVTYRNVEECIEKVNYLLEHETERKAIAAAGQRRTLKDHTVKQRVEQIDEIIRKHI